MTAPTTADNVTAVTHCTILGNTANWKRIQGPDMAKVWSRTTPQNLFLASYDQL